MTVRAAKKVPGIFVEVVPGILEAISANNAIFGNMPGNPDLDAEFEMINASVYDVDATYCYWGDGMDSAAEIEEAIFDENDSGSFGNIDYSDWLTSAP